MCQVFPLLTEWAVFHDHFQWRIVWNVREIWLTSVTHWLPALTGLIWLPRLVSPSSITAVGSVKEDNLPPQRRGPFSSPRYTRVAVFPCQNLQTSSQEMCEDQPLSILALEVLFHARLLLTALVCLTYFLMETNINTCQHEETASLWPLNGAFS